MKRDFAALDGRTFDVLVIGGGINGATCAYDAAQRGLSTALVERADFGGATSSNSSKIAHSGLRYLQHLDIRRLRQSVNERHLLTQNAPHLVNSQPVLFPLYGHGLKGREVMTIYVKLYDLLSPSRRRFADPDCRIANSHVISRAETLRIAPHIEADGLTGAAVWQEGQILSTERLLAAILHSAVDHGALLCNYAAASAIAPGDETSEITLTDGETGAVATVRARVVVNAAGPWIDDVLGLTRRNLPRRVAGSKAFSLLTRSLCETHALSFTARPMYDDRKAIADKGGSIQFAIPWRGHSLIGSLHLAAPDDPAGVGISDEEIDTYLAMINEGYPAAKLTRKDVTRILWGMIPGEAPGSPAPRKDYEIADHADDGLPTLISVSGVKYTTARGVAEKAIDLACRKLGVARPTRTDAAPLWGGDIDRLADFHRTARAELAHLPAAVVDRLLIAYGTRYRDVLRHADGREALLAPLAGSDVLKAEILFAMRAEMARRLGDVVLRRTDLGSLADPGDAALAECAAIMAAELGWDQARIASEIADVATRSGYLRDV